MFTAFTTTVFPLSDLVFGASLYFPPLFRAVLLGFFFWLLVHPLLRDWIYSGEIWHPTLLDLSLFILCVSAAQWLLLNIG
ncbi:DUF1656 domain-containing protein [Erwinia sp. E602]|uniref:DUF1656 domain-containing protein n=1 Tax=unclassified Erwinia TaxID=2622719 RepID=UPI0006FC6442|nr:MULTISPECIES: DUF1656 domain-containing protein [unclassified Erwinia]KQN53546.1 hypothetical protein ASF13_15430 [Erwinia sp. Leaf53]PLV55138.1 membrane protein [Erwinia sp. B116]QUG75542.1 DUF1656 domain-containing protein [Erwinia sp. E602]